MKKYLENKSLKDKLLLVVLAMIFIRLGSIIPLPGVNTDYMKALMDNNGLNFLHMITGNSFSQMSLFALSISPYITASIIIQLLTVVFPSLESLRKDGKTGKEKIEKITIGVGICLAFLQSLFMAIGFGGRGLLNPYSWWMVLTMTVVWTAGAALLMYIGNCITKLEIGNGISYILLCNILSTFPSDIISMYEVLIKGKAIAFQLLTTGVILTITVALVVACIILSTSVRKIPMTFSTKINERSVKQDLPIALNTCGVIPIIFAGSLMSLPILVARFIPNVAWLSKTANYFNQGNWFNIDRPKYTLGIAIYIILTYCFTLFYININFNAVEIANNLKQQGATIPGIRPGKPTSDYINSIAVRLALVGATFTLIIILTINALCNISNLGGLSIGGTSILICVSVIIEGSKIFKTALQSERSKNYYKNKKGNAICLFGLE